MMKNIIIIIALISLPIILQAQSTILNEYIKTGLASNLTLKKQALNIDKSLAALREANSLFMPKVDFNASYSLAGGGRSIDFPIGDLLNPVYSTLNALTQTNQFPQVDNEQITFLPHNFQETKIRVIQPLFNTDIYYNKKAKEAFISIEIAKKQVYEQELTKEIKVAYFQYLQSLEAVKIYKETKILLQEIQRTNQKLVKNNKATRDVIFNAKYEISKIDNEITQVQKNSELAKAYFNFLINQDLTTTILIDEKIIATEEAKNIDAQTNNAIQNRKELEQLKKAMTANEQGFELKKAQRLPEVALVIDAGFQGTGYHFLDNQAFVFGQVSLTWNIYDGQQRKAQLQQIKLDQQQLSTQYLQVQKQIELQVKSAYEEFLAAKSTVETSKVGLINAKEGFRLIKKQYENGATFFYQLVQAKTNLTNAKIALSIAEFDVLLKQAELEYAKGM